MADDAASSGSPETGFPPEVARRLLEAAPLVVLLLDLDGRIVQVNPYFERLTGFPLAEVRGRDWPEALVAPRDRERARRRLRAAAQGRAAPPDASTYADAEAVNTRSGDERDIEWSDDLLAAAEGAPARVLSIGRDVTERRRTERELRRNQDLLLRAERLARLGSWEWDLTTNEVRLSPEMYRLHGITPEGTPVATFDLATSRIPREDLDAVTAAAFAAMDTGRLQPVEYRMNQPDGAVVRIRGEGELRSTADGARPTLFGFVQDITAQRRAEGALREREEWLRLFIESVPAGVAMLDRAMRYMACSRRWLEDYGLVGRDIVGRSHYEVFPEIPERWREIHSRCLAGKAERREEDRFERADGSVDYLRWEIQPWRDASGAVGGLVFFTELITGRKLAEERLRRSEARLRERERELEEALREAERSRSLLRTVIDATPDWIFVKDREHRLVLVNRSFAASQGRTVEEMVGRPDTDFWAREYCVGDPARGIRGFHADDDEVLAGRAVHNPSDPATLADGTTRVFDTVKVPLRDASGATHGVLAYARDVTEARRAADEVRRTKEELEGSRRRLELATSAASMTLWHWHIASNIVTNSGTLGPGGAIAPPTSYEEFAALIHVDDRARVAAAVRSALDDPGAEYGPEFRIVLPEGSTRWLLDKGKVQRDAAGAPVAMYGVAIDVTERHEAEEERRALEAQLRQSQKMEAMGTLAGGIAHDFNNILTAILGNLALLELEAATGHDVTRYLVPIRRAGDRAKDLVRQILAFSRRRAQEKRVQPLGPLVEDVTRLLRATIPSYVEIVGACDADAPRVLADATQVHQVLMNLCTNAWHALGEKAGRIEVRVSGAALGPEAPALHAALRPGRYARLRVSDTGQGMTPAVMGRIFEPFFTTRGSDQGTGLGLSVVQQIVQGHGGQIVVSSRPGEGSIFDVYLPAAAESVDGAPALARAKAVPGRGQRVAYVDDESSLVMLVEQLLALDGFRVAGFSRPDAALAAIRADPAAFDALVTDSNMPGMTGIALVTEVLRLRPGLPVVLTSGHPTPELIERARDLGVRAVLCKPDIITELAGQLAEIFQDGGGP